MKQIKNDCHTNVMYDIAKVVRKLQIFVAHTLIDLSTVLIPNDGSFEQSLAGVISKETKIKLEESLKYLHQMQKRKTKKFDYYGLWGELEMMNHVIIDYSSGNKGIIRLETQNHYIFDQMVEWAEQEHFEYEETKVSCSKIDLSSMLIHNNRSKEESFGASNPGNVRLTILMKLQEALDEEAILKEQLLALMHLFADRFMDRRVEINNLMVLRDTHLSITVLPAYMEAEAKAELNKKAHSAVILCLGNKVLREVTGEMTEAGISEHIDEFNIIVLDLANIEEALTLEDVMAALNSKKIKKRSKANRDNHEGLYDHLKRNSPKNNRKKSTGYIKKDDQPSFIGLIYDSFEVMMLMSAEALVLLGDNMECKIRGIGKSCKVNVINGSRVVLSGTRKDNCVYSLDGHVVAGELNASFKEKDSLVRVWHKRLGHISEAGLHVLEKQELFGKKRLGCGFIFLVSSMRHLKSSKSGSEFKLLCIESEISRHLTVAGTSQQNGLAEQMNETPMDKGIKKLIRHQFTDYQWVRDREPMTRIKPLKFQDKSNMAAYAFPAVKEQDTHEALTYQEAVSWEDSFKRKDAIKEEIDSLRRTRLGSIQKPRYNARLVDHGFTQRAGIDYNKVFSLVVQHTSIRVILTLTECKDYELEQLDVNTTFLHGNLEEVIYMRQPPEYEQDDMMIACKSKAEIGFTKSLLKKEFDMKELRVAKKILGMEIFRDRSPKIQRVSQSGDYDVKRMSKVSYANVVGSLMYLMVYTRPDRAYADRSWKPCGRNKFFDLDYAKDIYKGRSINGYTFLVQGCVISWKATLQHMVALLTTNAEYMALTEAVKEAIWLRGLLKELGVELNNVAANCDNQGEIYLSRNHVFHERTKHINVRYHSIREVLVAKTVEVLKVSNEHNVVDALMNVVPGHKLQHCLELLNVGVG
uniref:Putative retrotransposon n=1 Tax=Tanacetum cinerariifolium TaxID=118510 RepID=A0A6L2MIA1_TANCI|nr:putative retrotransposon [Tanacetum cinerariifolium]